MGHYPIRSQLTWQVPQQSIAFHQWRGLALSLLILLGSIDQALCLDPSRTLTQCFHRIWQIQQGLTQPTILSLCQTGKGYIWMGTPTGLVRFDGTRFTTIEQFKGLTLKDAWIRVVAEDTQNNLWLTIDGVGVARIHDGTAKVFDSSSGLPSNDVNCLAADLTGGMWVGTALGLAHIVGDKVTSYRANAGLVHERITAISVDKNEMVWMGGDGNELTTWKDNQFKTIKIKELETSPSVTALWCASNGTVWIGTTDGLISWKKGVENRFTTGNGLTNDWINSVTGGRGGVIWVGTKDGFSRIHNDVEIQSFKSSQGLSHSTVYSMSEDHEGNLWVATKQGLNQFVERRTLPFTEDEGLPSNNTGPICQDSTGTMWIGTLDAGLAYYDGKKFVGIGPKDGLVGETVFALALGEKDDIWVGTNKGLCRVRGHKVVDLFTVEQGLSSDVVQCLLYGPDDSLWIGTARGLDLFKDGKITPFVRDENFPLPSILAMTVYRGTVVVAIQDEGVFRCIDGDFLPLDNSSTPNLGTLRACAFYPDEEGNLWMGTRGDGMLFFDGKSVVNMNAKSGLYDDEIFEIIPDSRQRLWMACSKGIFVAEKADLVRLAKGQLKKITCLPLTPTDLLRTIECQPMAFPTAYSAKDGRIWFSTIRGLVVLDPSRIQRTVPPPQVLVEDVIVDGEVEPVDEIVSLAPGESNLTFRYTALSFAAPLRINFRYILEGFDKDWIDAGLRREAFYTNLPPGDYKFRVSASYVDGPTGDVETPLAFTIRPYFYQTGWFAALCIGSVATAGWLIYRSRINRIEDRMHLVLSERTRIARELHDTLMQGFSGITLEMQALANRIPTSKEQNTLKEIIRDAGDCMTEARRSLVGLRSRQTKGTGLGLAIEQSARQMAESRGLRLKMKLGESPKDLSRDIEYNLLRIAQEAVANAVRHSSGKTVEVALNANQHDLELMVADDGVGLDAGGNSLRLGHFGIVGMKERANQIGAKFHLDSQPGKGTTIRVVLPRAVKE